MLTYQNGVPFGTTEEIRAEFFKKSEESKTLSTPTITLVKQIRTFYCDGQYHNGEPNASAITANLITLNKGMKPSRFVISNFTQEEFSSLPFKPIKENGKESSSQVSKLISCFRSNFTGFKQEKIAVGSPREKWIDYLLYCRVWETANCKTAQERINFFNDCLLQLEYTTLYPLSTQEFCVLLTLVYDLSYAEYVDLEKSIIELLNEHTDFNNWKNALTLTATPIFMSEFLERFVYEATLESSFADIKALAKKYVNDFAKEFARTRVRAYYTLRQLVFATPLQHIWNTLKELDNKEHPYLKSKKLEQSLNQYFALTYAVKRRDCKKFLTYLTQENAKEMLAKIGSKKIIDSGAFDDYVEDFLNDLLDDEHIEDIPFYEEQAPKVNYYSAEPILRQDVFYNRFEGKNARDKSISKLQKYLNAREVIAKKIQSGKLSSARINEIEDKWNKIISNPEISEDYQLALDYLKRTKSVTKKELLLMAIYFTTNEQIAQQDANQIKFVFNEIFEILGMPHLSINETVDFLFLSAIYNTPQKMLEQNHYPYRDFVFGDILEYYIPQEFADEFSNESVLE